MKQNVALIVAVLSLLAAGCRDSDKGGDGGNGGADADPGDELSIYDVRTGAIQAGDPVTLRGVVVTAIDARGNNTGDFWIAEPDEDPTHGRAYGGIVVFGADISAVAGIAPGDLIDLEGGVLDEFAFDCPECQAPLDTLAEIKAADGGSLKITKVGTADVPAPVVVSSVDIGASQEEADKWESVAITVENVAATSNPREIGGDSTRLDFNITGPISVQSSLGAIPEGVTRDDCFASVTGLGNYFFNFKILPRSAADLVAAVDDSGCLYETEVGACDDGIDNDFDGFLDCQDFSCSTANPDLCSIATTVVAVQDGTVPENSLVSLEGVVVTAVSTDGKDIWVQDAGSSADFNGLHVFRGSAPPALDANVVVGAVIDVSGTVEEFFFDTELVVASATADVVFVSAGAELSVRSDVPAATLGDETATGEPYEGMLVEITNVVVVNAADGFGGFTVGAAGTELTIDNQLFPTLPLPGAVGACYGRITGVMAEAFSDRKLYPRSAADVQAGCE